MVFAQEQQERPAQYGGRCRDALYAVGASRNTAIGGAALFSDTNGEDNTAVGALALWSNTNGSLNTAIGDNALFSNTVSSENTAVGGWALPNNTTGNANVAIGSLAAYSNFTGGGNTAVGRQRFLITNPATTTSRSGLPRATAPQAVTISSSAILVWRARATPSVLGETHLRALRPQHLSPVLAEPPSWATPLSWMKTVN